MVLSLGRRIIRSNLVLVVLPYYDCFFLDAFRECRHLESSGSAEREVHENDRRLVSHNLRHISQSTVPLKIAVEYSKSKSSQRSKPLESKTNESPCSVGYLPPPRALLSPP
mmetsp:Transcript_19449/g.54208  ORF Transcript_19449/g.54208 Transcript_19449/m.54208 type:complete len:111 (-) Transcript_19449:157-489(-)